MLSEARRREEGGGRGRGEGRGGDWDVEKKLVMFRESRG